MLLVSRLIRDGEQFVGPSTRLRRMAFCLSYGGQQFDIDREITRCTPWLDAPGNETERGQLVEQLQYLIEAARRLRDEWQVPDNPFDSAQWTESITPIDLGSRHEPQPQPESSKFRTSQTVDDGRKRDLYESDRDQLWIDDLGRTWEWSEFNGWVVEGWAIVGGYWPDGRRSFQPKGHPPLLSLLEIQSIYLRAVALKCMTEEVSDES